MIPDVRGGKSFGTAGMGRQVSADVEAPIVRTSKPVVTVVERHQKKEAMRQVIPEAAVEAARAAVRAAMIEFGPDGHTDGDEEITRAALEAAAPLMLGGNSSHPENFRRMVDAVLEQNGTPRRRLFEYPHRDDDSRDMIRSAEALVRQILAIEREEDTANGND